MKNNNEKIKIKMKQKIIINKKDTKNMILLMMKIVIR